MIVGQISWLRNQKNAVSQLIKSVFLCQRETPIHYFKESTIYA